MKKLLIVVVTVVLLVTGGVYAYTYTTATTSIGITEPTGDVATCNATADQPPWEDVLPSGGGVVDELDQEQTVCDDKWHDIKEDKYWAQSFAAGMTGTLTRVVLYLKVTGAPEPLIVELRNCVTENDTDGGFYIPGDTIYDSVESSEVVSTTGEEYEFAFTAEPQVTSGTNYCIVLRQKDDGGNRDNKYRWCEAENDVYTAGNNSKSDNGGADWKRGGGGGTHDQYFKTYVGGEEEPEICGPVPEGDLFIVTPHPDYTGDLLVKVYLVNTGTLIKAYQYLNMQLTLEGADENPQLLTLQNGEAAWDLQNCAGGTYTISVTGGAYCLVSDSPPEDCIIPEFYCEVTQR